MNALADYRLMATMQLEGIRAQMIFIAPVQFLLTGSLAIGLGFLIPNIDPNVARYLSTGAPTVSVLLVGLVVLPQELARLHESGADDFLRSLPVRPGVRLLAALTPHLVLSLPGASLSLAVASWYFDFTLHPNPLALVALAFVALTGAAIGNAVAAVIRQPLATSVVSNVLMFFVMLFSPINFPAERLPGWLQALHHVLPLEAMADLVRRTLSGMTTDAADWLHVAAWALASFAISARSAARRN